MKNIYRIIVICFWVTLTTNTFAQNANDALQQLLLPIQTLEADFTQKLLDKTAQPIQQANGHVVLARPGKFRWEVMAPTPQIIVANGEKLWIYDPDLEQVTIRLITKEVGETPALLLSNPQETLDRNFTVIQSSEKTAHLQWYVLTPKNKDSMLSSIKLGFDNQGQIQQMVLQDHLDHLTSIVFSHVVYNAPISAGTFHFEAPHDVDVIDETRDQK